MTDHGHDHAAHSPNADGAADGHGDHEEHGSLRVYLMVFAALCVLTGASFFTYSKYWPFPKHVGWAFMMAVSCTKAMLVIMFFMHLLWEANWKWVLTIPASFMSIFLMLMLVPDVGWRTDNGYARYSRERLLYAADPPEAAESEANHDPAGGAAGHDDADHGHPH